MSLTLWAIVLMSPLAMLVVFAGLMAYVRRLERIEREADAVFNQACGRLR